MTDAPLVASLVERLEVAGFKPTRTTIAGSVWLLKKRAPSTSYLLKAKLVPVTFLSILPGKASA